MNQTQEAMTRSLARSCLYRFFSEFFLYPKEGAFSKNFEEAFQASGALGQPAGLQETLAKAAGCPREITDLRSDYALVFGYTIGKACPPYETEWGTTHMGEKWFEKLFGRRFLFNKKQNRAFLY